MGRIIIHPAEHHLPVYIGVGHETEQGGKKNGDKSIIIPGGPSFCFAHGSALPPK